MHMFRPLSCNQFVASIFLAVVVAQMCGLLAGVACTCCDPLAYLLYADRMLKVSWRRNYRPSLRALPIVAACRSCQAPAVLCVVCGECGQLAGRLTLNLPATDSAGRLLDGR